MADKDEKDTKEIEDKDEVVIVTDSDLAQRAGAKEETSEDEDEGEDQEEESDQRLGKSEEEDDTEAESNRERRKKRKQRQKEARERLERENRYFSADNERMDREIKELRARLDGTQVFTIDSRIAQTEAAIKKADAVIADTVTNAKGDDHAEALRIRDGLKETLTQLKQAKSQTVARSHREDDEGGGEERTRRPANPVVVSKGKAWMAKNSWFDHERKDYVSRIAGAIDDSLADEGYDPSTDEYWAELDDRIAEVLPQLSKRKGKKANGRTADDGDDDGDEGEERGKPNGKAKGGPKFRSGGNARTLKKGEFYLSPARVDALKEAGFEPGTKEYMNMVKRYREHDKEAASQ